MGLGPEDEETPESETTNDPIEAYEEQVEEAITGVMDSTDEEQ